MATTADRLALLQRTKAGQRALLEEMYPDLDFSTVPFREYGRLFTGRKYVPGFVGGWKSYGRSNSEDASTRDILPDYSGNGRDIRLYNFAFAGMSGYGGYHDDFADFSVHEPDLSGNHIIGDVLHIVSVSNSVDTAYVVTAGQAVRLRVRVSGVSAAVSSGSIDYLQLYFDKFTAESSLIVTEDGEYSVDLVAPEGATRFYIYARHIGSTGWMPLDTEITIEQVPEYPGGLVSDGVDDYVQCVKSFALPDDYTVVAIRNIISGNNAAIASKGATAGAFLFDATAGGNNVAAWSYGYQNSLNNLPALFSYQTKTSYNGTAISFGAQEDSESDLLKLFTHNNSSCAKAVLYDLRIYDHTLTAEELAAVKDEMMSDYEAATGGGIADITYVADWDGKGRSNEEDEPMRSQWVDKKTGKVIELNNFGYAGLSGWNGYSEDFNSITGSAPSDITDHIILHTVTSVNNVWIWSRYSASSIYNTIASMRIKVIGVSTLSGTLRYYYIPDENPATRYFIDINSDGIYTLPSSVKYTGEGSHNIGLYLMNLSEASIGKTVKVEQLTLYPGALVGDGVDDYGVTQEAINEEVGTMLVMLEIDDDIKSGSYFINCGKNENTNRLYCWWPAGGIPKVGLPSRNITLPIGVLTRTPASPSDTMYIASYSGGSPSKMALYRFILIQEQLDDAAVEFLRWRVEKEYREWCKENGYEYAINQLIA